MTEHSHKDEGSLEDLIVSTQPPSRRRALMFIGASALSASALAACGGGSSGTSTTVSSSSTSSSTSTSSSASTTSGTCAIPLPEETNGPFPADGSNSVGGSVVNALTLTGIVRSDIRTSLAPLSGTASGATLTLTLTLVNTLQSCLALSGYVIYLWHCTADGKYSLYDDTTQNYLRGVQVTDANGQVTFTTVVPGCYSGRMPHIHIEVYSSLAAATSYTNRVRTTQLALDPTFAQTLYASDSDYGSSGSNLAAMTLATDTVFGTETPSQQAASTFTPTGSTSAGYTASVKLGIDQ